MNILLKQDKISNGIYIPKNLKERFIELDRLLSEEDRNTTKDLRDKKETIKYHHGLNALIRNMRRLWGGSRYNFYL